MITVKSDRSVYIPECDRHIGYENDNLVEQRIFEICDSSLFGFAFKLDLKKTLDIVDLMPYGETENSRLFSWNITSSAIGEGGAIIAQIRAFDESGEKVWHSEWLEFVAEPSVNAEKQISDERILSEFEQIEIRVQQAITGIESAAAKAEENASDAALSANSAEVSAQIADAERAAAEIAAGSAENAVTKAETAASNAEISAANASESEQQAKGYAEKAEKLTEYLSIEDKIKLDGIEEGANKTVVDTALDSNSQNPIANNAVFAEFKAINDSIGNIDSALSHIIAIEESLIAV